MSSCNEIWIFLPFLPAHKQIAEFIHFMEKEGKTAECLLNKLSDRPRESLTHPSFSFRLWREFQIQRTEWDGGSQPAMAWWLLALGVPQLFWKLQLGAQKVDDFGFKLFIGVLQLTQRQREELCSAPVTSQPCFPLSGARQSLPSHSSSAKAAQQPWLPKPSENTEPFCAQPQPRSSWVCAGPSTPSLQT